jgi:hypothetical protein
VNFLEILGCIFIGILILGAIGAIIDTKPEPGPIFSDDLPAVRSSRSRHRSCYACTAFAPDAIEVKTYKGPYYFHLRCLERVVWRAEHDPDLYLSTPEERDFFAACQIRLILHKAPEAAEQGEVK